LLLFARRRVVGGMECVAYPVAGEGGGCDAELRVVVLLMGATCVFQRWVSWIESRDPMSVSVVGQRGGLADWWSMMEGS
jgi:hypothetical protein